MSATITTPLAKIFDTNLSPSARSELIAALPDRGTLDRMTPQEIAAYVRDQVAAAVHEAYPGMESSTAYEIADAVTDPSAVLDPTTPAHRRAAVLHSAQVHATFTTSLDPAPF